MQFTRLASTENIRHGPLLIRVLSINWTNKKPDTRSDTLEETASSDEIRSWLDSHPAGRRKQYGGS